MRQVRAMHYLNQFFAGMGGEDKADLPLNSREGVMGPGKRLQQLLGDSAEIVITVYCGDNYFALHHDEALESILEIARNLDVKLLIAGPAFASGRYGFACVEICHFLSTSLGLDCVTAIHPENPGVEAYGQYKDKRVFALPATEAASGMEDALSRMARFVSKLAAGSAIGLPSDEGYIPRGFRRDEVESKSGAERAVAMLLEKIAGRSFATEIPCERLEGVPVPPRIANVANACLALVTSGGVIPMGNPDGFRVYQNTKWARYAIHSLDSMLDASWDVIHGGYNTQFMVKNPNYGVPLDACRELEKEGAFSRLHPYFYVTSGSRGLISVMQSMGGEMVLDMKADGVDAVLLVSTWGSCTRSGSAIARAIEKAGMPVAFITAMTMLAKQFGVNRIVAGTKIPHPCGDPNFSPEVDKAVRREIVKCALSALETDVSEPTVFVPNVTYTLG